MQNYPQNCSAFSQAFVPVLAATREKDGDASTRELIDQIATVLAWALTATCVIGVARKHELR